MSLLFSILGYQACSKQLSAWLFILLADAFMTLMFAMIFSCHTSLELVSAVQYNQGIIFILSFIPCQPAMKSWDWKESCKSFFAEQFLLPLFQFASTELVSKWSTSFFFFCAKQDVKNRFFLFGKDQKRIQDNKKLKGKVVKFQATNIHITRKED